MDILAAFAGLWGKVGRIVGGFAEYKPGAGVKHGTFACRVVAVEPRVTAVKPVFGGADPLKIFQLQF